MLLDATDDVRGALNAAGAVLLNEPLHLRCVLQPWKLSREAEAEHSEEPHVMLALNVLPKIFLEIRVLNPAQLICLRAGVWPTLSVESTPPAKNPTCKCA